MNLIDNAGVEKKRVFDENAYVSLANDIIVFATNDLMVDTISEKFQRMDATTKKVKRMYKRSAEAFFQSSWFYELCEIMGMDAKFIKNQINQLGGLNI